jgi:hypothetical protein
MDIKRDYPDFASIEAHIRRARLQRSLALSQVFARAAVALGRGFRKLGESMSDGLAAERDRRAIEADAFLKRSVPKY